MQCNSVDQEILTGYGSPYYFNAGEIFVVTSIAIITVTLALSLDRSITQTFATIEIAGHDNTLLGQWLSTIIIAVFTAIFFIFLFKMKRQFMIWANRNRLLHNH